MKYQNLWEKLKDGQIKRWQVNGQSFPVRSPEEVSSLYLWTKGSGLMVTREYWSQANRAKQGTQEYWLSFFN